MGRTVPSFRMVLEAEIAKWKRFLQTLPSKAEKEAFEELMNHCRRHAGAAGAAVRPIRSSDRSLIRRNYRRNCDASSNESKDNSMNSIDRS